MDNILSVTDLSPIQLDALREVGNIGAGNAATAFAQFLGRKIDMTVPKVMIVELSEVPELFGGPDVPVAGVSLRVMGEAPGHMLFLLERSSAFKLIEVLGLGNKRNSFSDMEISALKEIVNILSGSYLTAFNQVTGFSLIQSVPAFAMDMAGAILGTFMIEFGQIGDYGLLVETEFHVDGEEISGNFFLIPGQDSLRTIITALGLEAYYESNSC
ncbi:CheY-P-specific phosphatase CheC [Anoxybacter fermentans]|uniref:CheY-P-specific phosphatase CheC n=1 Tax=Anoxybacter fermentans TaxID=1323375 RepID=A0A3Q9HP37_9FIRM|nr:chemotaxis protein CheC [Anoxybacter fermentans]AZR72369.1 CheY-P-specific phosphatase CheC [Anoxybacter fermentans]